MKNRHFGGECSWILAGKARKCGRFWVFACVPNPGKQSIWRQCPPSARKQSTKKLPNRPGFTHVQYPPFGGPPLFYQAPPRQFQPPKCNLTPSKMCVGERTLLCNSTQTLQIGRRQSLSGGHFGRRQFTIWRLKFCWGCFIERGDPQKEGTWVPATFLCTGIGPFRCESLSSDPWMYTISLGKQLWSIPSP